MTTDQKTPGQVLYEADAARTPIARNWWQLSEAMRGLYEADAAAVLAHDRANQPATSGVWIPVSERLPDEDEPVLVVHDGGCITVMARQDSGDGWLWAIQRWAGSLERQDGFEVDDDYEPTHWQPLPAAPEAPKPSQTEAL